MEKLDLRQKEYKRLKIKTKYLLEQIIHKLCIIFQGNDIEEQRFLLHNLAELFCEEKIDKFDKTKLCLLTQLLLRFTLEYGNSPIDIVNFSDSLEEKHTLDLIGGRRTINEFVELPEEKLVEKYFNLMFYTLVSRELKPRFDFLFQIINRPNDPTNTSIVEPNLCLEKISNYFSVLFFLIKEQNKTDI